MYLVELGASYPTSSCSQSTNIGPSLPATTVLVKLNSQTIQSLNFVLASSQK